MAEGDGSNIRGFSERWSFLVLFRYVIVSKPREGAILTHSSPHYENPLVLWCDSNARGDTIALRRF
jgi:hypothetical protein